MTIKELNEKTFDSFIKKNKVVVDFWAPWCGPCKIMAPEFEKAAAINKDIMFAKVNVDEHSEIAGRFGILSIPTTLFFHNSEIVDRITGAVSSAEIAKRVKESF